MGFKPNLLSPKIHKIRPNDCAILKVQDIWVKNGGFIWRKQQIMKMNQRDQEKV